MKKILLFSFVICVLLLTSCSLKRDIVATEELTSSEYTIEGVSSLNIKNISLKQKGVCFGPNVHILKGESKKIVIDASKDILERLNVTSYYDTVEISGNKFENYVTKSVDIYLYNYEFRYIHFSNVNATIDKDVVVGYKPNITLSGAACVNIEEINNTDLDLNLSGASKIEIGSLEVENLNIELSGASYAILCGNTSKMDVSLSGASQINADSLDAANVEADLSGASKLSVRFTSSLCGDLSGASEIIYYSESTNISVSTSGASKVKKG
ncbi:MAG: GIN domain-containing protein [Anaeroplasmataceae bacterium]